MCMASGMCERVPGDEAMQPPPCRRSKKKTFTMCMASGMWENMSAMRHPSWMWFLGLGLSARMTCAQGAQKGAVPKGQRQYHGSTRWLLGLGLSAQMTCRRELGCRGQY